LIPFSPLVGALFVGLLLISFDKTMNRLSKPVSYILIACVAFSTILSFILYRKNIVGYVFDWNLNLASTKLHLAMYVDSVSEKAASFCGLCFLILMIVSYYLMERKKGYVRYFVLLALSSSFVFSFVFSGDFFHRLI